jgi:hypothetical protein
MPRERTEKGARRAFPVLLHKDERAAMQRAADAAHLPLGTWLRTVALREAQKARR